MGRAPPLQELRRKPRQQQLAAFATHARLITKDRFFTGIITERRPGCPAISREACKPHGLNRSKPQIPFQEVAKTTPWPPVDFLASAEVRG